MHSVRCGRSVPTRRRPESWSSPCPEPPAMPLLSFGFCNQFPVHGRKAAEIRSLRQHLSLKSMQARRQGRTMEANLLQADQAEGRMNGKAIGVVEVFISSQAAVDRLAHQIRQGPLRVLAATRIG